MRSLSEHEVNQDPIQQFAQWWDEALQSEILEVNAMALSTITAAGRPSARIVLLKGFDQKGFVFFTNYESDKGIQLQRHPYASLVFFWKELERQVRIEGTCSRTSDQESDEYFQSRPLGSRLGAWASPQSRTIPNRDILQHNMEELKAQYAHDTIPRPPHWGGFRVQPDRIEFWQGRSNRLHDRILYEKNETSWRTSRLAP